MTCVTRFTVVRTVEQIVVVRGPLELAADVDDHQEMAGVFDLAIRDPALAEHLGPGHLEVDEVIRVVQEPHAVGLGVAHADRDVVADVHENVAPHLENQNATVSIPCIGVVTVPGFRWRAARALARRPAAITTTSG